MDLIIRDALESDIVQIAMNNIDLALETEGRSIDRDTALRGVEAVLRDEDKGYYLVAEICGKILGQCLVTREWSDWRNGYFWWVQSVFVDSRWRKKGVFSLIFDKLIEKAKESLIVGIRVYVDRGNTTALEVYRSVGLKQSRYSMLEMEMNGFQ